MSTVEELDPFTLVYNGLWGLVERNPYLREFIIPGNRIKFTDQEQPKLEISDADTPELQLLTSGGNFGKNTSTTHRGCTRTYSWYLTTGDIRLNPLFNKISFELWRSLLDYYSVLCALQWRNCRFVTDARLNTAQDSIILNDTEISRAIPGWASIWDIEVDLVFEFNFLKI